MMEELEAEIYEKKWELERLEIEKKKNEEKLNLLFGIGLVTGVLIISGLYKFKSKNTNKWKNKKFWISLCSLAISSITIYSYLLSKI